MSFGFSISDCALLVHLAATVISNSRAAVGEHDEFTREVKSMRVVLQRLHSEASKPEGLLNTTRDNRSDELRLIVKNCRRILKKVNKQLEEYNDLHGTNMDRGFARAWRTFRFGNFEMKKLEDVRLRVGQYKESMTLYLNLILIGSQGRVEKQMTELGADMQDLKHKLNLITASRQVAGREGSLLTSYAEDDKAAWKDLRRILIAEGFSSKTLSRYRDLIKDYLLELGARGALDELPEEPSSREWESASSQLDTSSNAVPRDRPWQQQSATNDLLNQNRKTTTPYSTSALTEDRTMHKREPGAQNLTLERSCYRDLRYRDPRDSSRSRRRRNYSNKLPTADLKEDSDSDSEAGENIESEIDEETKPILILLYIDASRAFGSALTDDEIRNKVELLVSPFWFADFRMSKLNLLEKEVAANMVVSCFWNGQSVKTLGLLLVRAFKLIRIIDMIDNHPLVQWQVVREDFERLAMLTCELWVPLKTKRHGRTISAIKVLLEACESESTFYKYIPVIYKSREDGETMEKFVNDCSTLITEFDEIEQKFMYLTSEIQELRPTGT